METQTALQPAIFQEKYSKTHIDPTETAQEMIKLIKIVDSTNYYNANSCGENGKRGLLTFIAPISFGFNLCCFVLCTLVPQCFASRNKLRKLINISVAGKGKAFQFFTVTINIFDQYRKESNRVKTEESFIEKARLYDSLCRVFFKHFFGDLFFFFAHCCIF